TQTISFHLATLYDMESTAMTLLQLLLIVQAGIFTSANLWERTPEWHELCRLLYLLEQQNPNFRYEIQAMESTLRPISRPEPSQEFRCESIVRNRFAQSGARPHPLEEMIQLSEEFLRLYTRVSTQYQDVRNNQLSLRISFSSEYGCQAGPSSGISYSGPSTTFNSIFLSEMQDLKRRYSELLITVLPHWEEIGSSTRPQNM
ncbi:hypothetical protein QAD02_000288, partial [Eretmocerus hayati]